MSIMMFRSIGHLEYPSVVIAYYITINIFKRQYNTAEIINLYVSNAKKQVGNKESYINKYYMVFKYKIDNTDHQTTQCVKETTYNKFKIGDVINIKTYNNVGVLNENIRQI